jgi:transcriptional regulator with XRE-family HTH domain
VFYDRLDALCAEHGLTISKLLETLGLSKSSASRWKTKGYLPSREASKKIADYFGITVRELLSEETESSSAEAEDDEMAEILEEIRRRPDLKVLFSLSKNATPEDVRKSIKIIKTICGDEDGNDNY